MSAIAHHWADVVSETALSGFFQSHLWIIPTSQSIHIACVSVVFACGVRHFDIQSVIPGAIFQ
jgi:hypothetical protein